MTKVYVVRLQENHELIGIFAARNPEDLWYLIDEREDPTQCEYINVDSGGIFCTDNFIVEPKTDPEEERKIPTAYYGFTELWRSVLNGQFGSRLKWRSFKTETRKAYGAMMETAKTIPDEWSFC